MDRKSNISYSTFDRSEGLDLFTQFTRAFKAYLHTIR